MLWRYVKAQGWVLLCGGLVGPIFLAVTQVTGITETGTRINDQPLVKLNLHISGRGIAPFEAQDRVIGSMMRVPNITARKLVVLVEPSTHEYQIDWERSSLINGLLPATFTVAEDTKTYDLSGQPGPLMEILQILKAHNIGINNMIDLRSNPAARQQVQAVVRHAAAQQQAPAPAAAVIALPQPSTAQRLQELETLRATAAITDDEYATKRQQILANL